MESHYLRSYVCGRLKCLRGNIDLCLCVGLRLLAHIFLLYLFVFGPTFFFT